MVGAISSNLFTMTTYGRFGLHGYACSNEGGEDALKERHNFRTLTV
jgi:hypothetical protein